MNCTAVILTHNDERTIARAIQSIIWCDEIIIIDDASTDTTASIAKKLGATVYTRALADDFASQRNFGLSKAQGEWVLFLDSDEVVSPKSAQEIIAICHPRPASPELQRGEPNRGSRMKKMDSGSEAGMTVKKESGPEGYYIKRKDWFFGRWLTHGETANVQLLRLARKDAGQWVRPVHEIWEVVGFVGHLDHPLEHYPHPTIAEFLDKVNRYSTLNARHLYQQGIRVFWWHSIAYPIAKFFLNYYWRLGFLDGTAGIVMALMMSVHSFLTRAKLWQLWDTKKATL